jgi:CheY-like chemotaxis protein/anti-sigma regulatory factor (Ser/Thr protein kinase)
MPFNLRELVEDVAELFAEAAQGKMVELACDLPVDLPGAWVGDAERLRQILTNLVGNAIKFTSQGEVVLALRVVGEVNGQEGRLRFEVRDSGIGIREDAMKRIFESFTQADGKTTREFGGTGLGLAICKQLVDLMDGEIGVHSVYGQGATFWFEVCLPRFSGTVEPLLAVETLRGLHVLVVDDNETNREILYHQLGAWGMLVECVEGGPQGLEALRAARAQQNNFDLVILDMHMPRMDGLGVARAVSADPMISGVPMILLSSVCHAEKNQTMRAAGILRHMTKPARQSELYDCITDLMLGGAEPGQLAGRASEAGSLTDAGKVNGHVLLVEDNPVNREVARCMLDNTGCQVECAGNGRDALDILNSRRFDLVLMDCQMPEMDGFEATRELRRMEADAGARQRLPVVALTANAMQGDRELCLEAGMDDYLSKPLGQAELAGVLKRWLPVALAPGEPSQPAADAQQAPAQDRARSAERNPISRQALENITGLEGGDAILAKVIDIYLNDSPRILSELRAALAEQSADSLRRAAHKFKSSSANLGAERLAELCKQLEAIGRTEQIEGAAALLENIEQEYRLAESALRDLSAELPA